MSLPRRILRAAVVFVVLVACAAGYMGYRIQSLPPTAPERLVREPSKALVVLAGASVTRGSMSQSYVELLEQQLGSRFQFANAGRNGDLAYNLAERLDPVVALRPDIVVLQIGTNDVNASLSPEAAASYQRLKKLPVLPTREFYRENLVRIVKRLRTDAQPRLAILSLPVMGEDLASVENAHVRDYNEVIREVAGAEGLTYLPLYESMAEVLEKTPSPHPTQPASSLIAKSMLKHYLLGRSYDAIGQGNGYQLLSDGIHLNSKGAALVADRIEAFLTAKTSKVFDLGHPLRPGDPSWNGPPGYQRTDLATVAKDGYAEGKFSALEHFGTHVDAPSHFAANGWTVDQIPVDRFHRPGVCINVEKQVETNVDYQVTVADIQAWEKANGPIEEGSIVLIATGWDTRWPDRARWLGETKGVKHYPGLSAEADAYLSRDRKVAAIGIDSPSIDFGPSTEFEAHQVSLGLNVYHIENAAHLVGLSARGFTVVVAPINLAGGSGGPARVFAVVD